MNRNFKVLVTLTHGRDEPDLLDQRAVVDSASAKQPDCISLSEIDAPVAVPEWKAFEHLNLAQIRSGRRNQIVFDGRNISEPVTLRAARFEYAGIGRA